MIFQIVNLLYQKGYAICKQHNATNRYISEHFQFQIGGAIQLWELG